MVGSDSSAATAMSEEARPKAENAEATGPSGTITSPTPTSAAYRAQCAGPAPPKA